MRQQPNFEAIRRSCQKKEYGEGISKNQKRAIRLAAQNYFIEGDVLYHTTKEGKKRKVVINGETRHSLLVSVHQGTGEGVVQASLEANLGRDKIASKLEKFWWPAIKRI